MNEDLIALRTMIAAHIGSVAMSPLSAAAREALRDFGGQLLTEIERRERAHTREQVALAGGTYAYPGFDIRPPIMTASGQNFGMPIISEHILLRVISVNTPDGTAEVAIADQYHRALWRYKHDLESRLESNRRDLAANALTIKSLKDRNFDLLTALAPLAYSAHVSEDDVAAIGPITAEHVITARKAIGGPGVT